MNIWLGITFLSGIPPARSAGNFDQFPLTRGKKINESARLFERFESSKLASAALGMLSSRFGLFS